MKYWMFFLMVLPFSIISCKSTQKSKEQKNMELTIAGYSMPCKDATSGKCLVVQQSGGDWELFSSEIKGWEHQEGYRTQIKVAVEERPDETVPQYTFLEEINQQMEESMRLYDIWVVRSMQGKELPKGGAIPNMEINLRKMKIMGNTGCNQYNADIQWLTPEKIQLGMLAATRKMCKNMEIPNQFKQLMRQVKAYRLEKLQLFLLDKEGNELIRLHKVD